MALNPSFTVIAMKIEFLSFVVPMAIGMVDSERSEESQHMAQDKLREAISLDCFAPLAMAHERVNNYEQR